MTDEEKQAIDKLQCTIEINQNILDGIEIDESVIKSMETILNLIGKQQKEIIEELKESDFTTAYMQGFYDGLNKFKDKIKAKIDLIDKEYAEFIEKNKNDLDLVNINAQRHNAMQTILEELLGGTDGKD